MMRFNKHPYCGITFLNKVIYQNYFCLAASNQSRSKLTADYYSCYIGLDFFLKTYNSIHNTFTENLLAWLKSSNVYLQVKNK